MSSEGNLRPPSDQTLISVVLPLYNEVAVIRRLHEAVADALARCGCQCEFIFVDDGSGDGSDVLLDRLAACDPRVRVLHLSRNFGHQAAVQAGLLHAQGDAVVVMDSDMQDDPGSLPEFVAHWRAGYDVVYAVRTNRKEGPLKRALFFAFYRLLNLVSSTPLPNDAGNFGLVDRRVAESIAGLGEHDRYYSGLRCWVGFRQIGVPVERGPRHDEKPRVSFLGLVRLAKTALFSFSSAPLGLFYAVSAASLIVCCAFTCFTLYHKLVTGLAIPGWTSTIVVASFFGALNALGIGVLGEYVVRIYDQVRGRPKFIVDRRVNFAEPFESPDGEERRLAAEINDLRREVQTATADDKGAAGIEVRASSPTKQPTDEFPGKTRPDDTHSAAWRGREATTQP
jgi:dolichol-phosphate mannosyltransferase